ncbi:unnamed protein product [Fusarium venenatum]|uniref:Uncharacterized protein n=1 Tax=Fusarium venenatum TaxID=56646 RepID=A0A2L2SN22_9HYPO|nr:unnamed protein product [Fusarium venenatum]
MINIHPSAGTLSLAI